MAKSFLYNQDDPTLEHNTKYPLEKKGFIVLIWNTKVKLPYLYDNDIKCLSLPKSESYSRKVKELFESASYKLIEKKLCADNEEGFGDWLANKWRTDEGPNVKPDFLMLFLTSASQSFGEYILNDDDDDDNNERCVDCYSDGKHSHKENCCVRLISEFVRNIQTAKYGVFSGIPKVFVMQTLTGLPITYTQGPDEEEEPQRLQSSYIPRGSDTWVMYAHAVQDATDGFYVLEKYLKTLESCKKKLKERCDDMKEHIRELVKSTQFSEEDFLDIRFDNLCMTVAAQIAEHVEGINPDDAKAMRLHISSTLRKTIFVKRLLAINN